VTDLLQNVQELQFKDKSAAEALLLRFLNDEIGFATSSVELRPLAVSLNSFNGFITQPNGQKLFFKTHTESDTVVSEYYNAFQLSEAGYPVLKPIFSSTQTGKQLLIYEVIHDPSVFDVAWLIEQGNDAQFDTLTAAQNQADDKLREIYLHTLKMQSAESAAKAPIHQLFHHRLAQGRMERFYGMPNRSDKNVRFPLHILSMKDMFQFRWRINNVEYVQTLADIVDQAINVLHPSQQGIAIVGHGDAHNGNVFFRQAERSLLYFDPAFAGEHDPLLDLAKPLFHNVFAMWMYHPAVKSALTKISVEVNNGVFNIEHEYQIHAVRHMFLDSKVDRVIIPILAHLKGIHQLREDWKTYLKCALFCCPFLTMNLLDEAKFDDNMRLLGFVMCIEMGSRSAGDLSFIDHLLKRVEHAL
jgi:hypothetical protein